MVEGAAIMKPLCIGPGGIRIEDRGHFKIVRADSLTDVPGEIITADEATGKCSVHVGGETKMLSFGPGGIRIVGRGR